MTRATDPQITFADLEFLRQGIDLDPVLEKISSVLDAQPKMVELVRQKDMLFSLEGGVDVCEDAMDVIRSVVVKNG